jgi:hypothetical protein
LLQGIWNNLDSLDGRPVLAKEHNYLVKYVFFFADICLLESDFIQHSTSLTSAAIIGMFARVLLLQIHMQQNTHGCSDKHSAC